MEGEIKALDRDIIINNSKAINVTSLWYLAEIKSCRVYIFQQQLK